ncbi:MAG: hypothetical protein ACRENE_28640 [Polyangiaceae bacterium]
MIRTNRWSVMVVALALGSAAQGCNDVGDNTGMGNGQGADATSDDASQGDDGAASADAGSEHSFQSDGGSADGNPGTEAGDAPATEDGGLDSTTEDSPGAETSAESGPPEAGGSDASEEGPADSGGVDSTVPEAGVDGAPETGADASEGGGFDAAPEAAPDTGSDSGGLVPCTNASQTACIKCDGNTNGLCTPTEALILARDIAQGNIDVDAGVPDPAASCYYCLWNAGCIDDDVNLDSNKECGDLTGTVGAGAQSTETKTDACIAALTCTLSSGCANAKSQNGSSASDGISNCFCGAAYLTTTLCQTATSSAPPNGSCYQSDLDGLGDTASTSISNVLGAFTTRTSGAGMSNAIFQCAGSNTASFTCPTCF